MHMLILQHLIKETSTKSLKEWILYFVSGKDCILIYVNAWPTIFTVGSYYVYLAYFKQIIVKLPDPVCTFGWLRIKGVQNIV